MVQEILFRRNSTTPVYSNEEAAWDALNNITHKVAQPVVAFYEKSNTIGGIGDSSIAAVFGIGTADGKGKYQGFASQEDFLSIYSEYASFKNLWDQMFELVEIEQTDGIKESFIKAKLSLFSLGEIISGGTPDGEDGEVLQGSLAILRDVSNDGEGNVVIHGTSTPVSNGCIFTFQNGTWAADTESTFVARIKQTLLDSGIASVDYVDTAIANAIEALREEIGGGADTSDFATKEELAECEEVAAAALNELNDRVNEFSKNVSRTTVTKEELTETIDAINAAINATIIENEEIAAAALNELNDRVNDLDTKIKALEAIIDSLNI